MVIMEPRTVVALVAAVALSGCLGLAGDETPPETPAAPSEGADPGDEVNASTASQEVFDYRGNVSTDVTWFREENITVRANATRITVRGWWNGTATDLDVGLRAPKPSCGGAENWTHPEWWICTAPRAVQGLTPTQSSGEGWWKNRRGTPANPDAPATVTVGERGIEQYTCDDPPCDWTAWIDGFVVKDTRYHLRVTVEYS